MLTINYAIENKIPLDKPLNDVERQALLEENKDNDFSYLSLLREMLSYRHTTVKDILNGWSGIKLVSLPLDDAINILK